MEVIAWTPSWFGRRASIMELSLYRQSQSGMLVSCSCSLLLLWPTLDPSPSIVPSFQPWKHMMILKMVIIFIIHIIAIIAIICICLHYENYAYYINYCWMIIACRMVGVCWIACGIRAWLQKTYPVRRSHSEYPGQTSLGACRCLYGPVTCNKSHWIAACDAAGRKVPCDHDASPCLGHATVCSGCPLTILIGSLDSASAW